MLLGRMRGNRVGRWSILPQLRERSRREQCEALRGRAPSTSRLVGFLRRGRLHRRGTESASIGELDDSTIRPRERADGRRIASADLHPLAVWGLSEGRPRRDAWLEKRTDASGHLSAHSRGFFSLYAVTRPLPGFMRLRYSVGDWEVTRRKLRLNCERDWKPTS